MYDQLPVEAVGTGYGLTEATAMVSNTGYDDGPDVVARCSGRPIPGIEVKVVDTDGDELPAGSGRAPRARVQRDARLRRGRGRHRRGHRQ